MSFAETRWSLVLAARDAKTETARTALSDLCAAYYHPVFVFLRSEGRAEDTARDLAHDFFARLLAGGVGAADPLRGRFRSFLLASLKNFLSDQRDRQLRLKRGGGAEHLPLETSGEMTSDCAPPPADTRAVPPDAVFDRHWAMTVLDRALTSLETTMREEGKAILFTNLKPWLAGSAEYGEQSRVAAELGLTENALRVAIHRLRQRYRDALRAELVQTVGPGIDADEELNHLRTALVQAS